jgi:hypothetical protein
LAFLETGDELSPTVFRIQILVKDVVGTRVGMKRFTNEPHARFLRCSAGLAVIAALAGRHQVFPCVSAASVSRYYMVDRELMHLLTAIHAREMIALEDLTPRETHFWAWPADHVDESDYRRSRIRHGCGPKQALALFEHLRLAMIEKDEGATNVADVQRLVVLVQNKNRGIEHLP